MDIQTAKVFFRVHAVGPLCHHALLTADAKDLVPTAVWNLLHRESTTHVALELARGQQDAFVLQRLDEIGLQPLVLKGTAYAQILYPESHLRPRCDTDLLFPDKESAQKAWKRLEKEGYEISQNAIEGRYVSRQRTCVKPGVGGHALDLHWSISNTHTFVRALPYDELDRDAIPLQKLHEHARTLSPVHGLLFACAHFFGHERKGHAPGLLWQYDILLLGRQLSSSDWETFSRKAIAKGIAGICRYTLDRVNGCFPIPAIKAVRSNLLEAEATEAFRPDRLRTPLLYGFHDLKALDGWAARLGWIRESVFPARAYIQNKNGKKNDLWLPLLYLQRAASGLAKRMGSNKKGY